MVRNTRHHNSLLWGQEGRHSDSQTGQYPVCESFIPAFSTTEFNLKSKGMRHDGECSSIAQCIGQMAEDSTHQDGILGGIQGHWPIYNPHDSRIPPSSSWLHIWRLKESAVCMMSFSIVSMNYGGIWLSDSTGIISKAVKIASYRDYFYDAILTCLIMNPSYLRYKDSCKTA